MKHDDIVVNRVLENVSFYSNRYSRYINCIYKKRDLDFWKVISNTYRSYINILLIFYRLYAALFFEQYSSKVRHVIRKAEFYCCRFFSNCIEEGYISN